MRSFLDIVNDMLRAGREGDLVNRFGYQEEMEDPKVQEDNADLLDLINY
jgi:hypothetical protein